MPRLQQNKKLSKYIELPEEMVQRFELMDKIFIAPIVKVSQRYSIPIIYINPQNFASTWSKKIRNQGGIVFKFWDRPVNSLAKICEYAEYRRNHS